MSEQLPHPYTEIRATYPAVAAAYDRWVRRSTQRGRWMTRPASW